MPFVVAIDECHSAPCQNDGVCSNHGAHFSCRCVGGFTGVLCETGECGGEVSCRRRSIVRQRFASYHLRFAAWRCPAIIVRCTVGEARYVVITAVYTLPACVSLPVACCRQTLTSVRAIPACTTRRARTDQTGTGAGVRAASTAPTANTVHTALTTAC